MATNKSMQCLKPPGSTEVSKYSCPITYCPPNSSNQQFGNFSASTCVYDEYLASNGQTEYHFGCIERDYCNMQMNCSQIAFNENGLPNADIGNATDWGKRIKRVVSSGCDAGNYSSVDYGTFLYNTIAPFGYAEPVPASDSTTSAANSLDTSSLLVYMLVALLFMNISQKFVH